MPPFGSWGTQTYQVEGLPAYIRGTGQTQGRMKLLNDALKRW